jgi:hypothetical protein
MRLLPALWRVAKAFAAFAAFAGLGVWTFYAGWWGPRHKVLGKLALAPGDAVVAFDLKWENRDDIASRIGDFYVDDPAVLARVAEKWVTGGPAPYFLCGYNYRVFLVSKGVVVDEVSINLESGCNTLVDAKGSSYWFPPSHITAFERDYKKPRVETRSYPNLPEARLALAALRKDPAFLMLVEPEWRDFDGTLKLKTACDFTPASHTSSDACLDEVRRRLKERYPADPHAVAFGGSTSQDGKLLSLTVRVTSTEAFRKKQDLFDVEKDSWQPLEPKLKVAFKT